MEDIFFISLNPSKAFLRSANNWFEICCAGIWKNSWRIFQRFRETISHSHTVGSINEQKFALLPSVIRISILPSDSCCQPLIPLDRSFPTILYRICVYITLISNRSRRVHQARLRRKFVSISLRNLQILPQFSWTSFNETSAFTVLENPWHVDEPIRIYRKIWDEKKGGGRGVIKTV